jgi:ATPase subunit of ABC transporter with duplicated ATPase domains
MNDKTLIRLVKVVAGYHQPIVGPVSFEVHNGEVVGLRGANGSGKTTLLAAITGESRVFSGSIERRPGLSVAHQHQRFHRLPEMPFLGREFLQLMGASTFKQAPPVIASAVSQRLDRLSGGQLQFLQVWSCLGSPAELVLLDEPTNNLDPETAILLREELSRTAPPRGVIVVSHEDDFLQAVCHRTVCLHPENL